MNKLINYLNFIINILFMCGIFGIIHNNSNSNITNLIDIINSLKHRGKDSYGIS